MNRLIKTRTDTNLEILTNKLYIKARHIHANHWPDGLLFLQYHNLDPPTFCQTLIIKINHWLERKFLNTYYSVLESCTEAHKQASNKSLQHTSEFDPSPIWKLPFIFERLVLGPKLHDPNLPKHKQKVSPRLPPVA